MRPVRRLTRRCAALRSLAAALLAAAVVTAGGCELPEEEPLADGAAAPLTDTATGDAAAASDVAAGDPVPCAALSGRWQVTLCRTNAAPVELLATGCAVLLVSADATFDSGEGRLDDGRDLTLTLPGGVFGPQQCAASMTETSFTGTCESAAGTCPIAGVKSW